MRYLAILYILWYFLFSPETAAGQSVFWVGFTDKAESSFSTAHPLEFLSERSVERRIRQNIAVTEEDLPVNNEYADQIRQSGATILYALRWMNGVVVKAGNDSLQKVWEDFPFVREIEMVRPHSPETKSARNKFGHPGGVIPMDTSYYGLSAHQVGQLNGHYFHSQGMEGQGMLIAVLDAGFYKANLMPALSHLYVSGRIAGIRDFVNPGSDVYLEHEHGTMVLSTMAGLIPGQLVGTAPAASYLMIRTEDASSEYRIEEFNWIAGAEYADSIGADIINSSLGYSDFDDPSMNYRYSDMDGMTTRVTRGANMAADRGILVFSSAGNEGLTEWKHIVAPADGTEVIAVGAVDSERKYATFSSMGPGAGGLVKPDLAAMGRDTAVQSSFGSVVPRSGTSFASPVMAGMAACLWQANPDVPAAEIRRIMQIAGHQHNKPDHLLGYGIPDMHLAHMILNQFNVPDDPAANSWTLFPNPFSDRITLIPETAINRKTDFEVFTLSGQLMERFSEYTGSYTRTFRLAHLTPGVYLIRISTENTSEVHKLVKSQ